jgi:hypothetical protein
MGKGMKESDIEGIANHDGPESCVGVRKGAGEALTGVRAGQAIESRNHPVRGADAVTLQRKATSRPALFRELAEDPSRSENQGMHGIPMRENREVPRSPVRKISGLAAQGRLRPQA